MADRSPPPHQVQVHPQQSRSGPSTSQILAIVTLLPVGGTLLCLAGLTLAGTLVGLAVTTPLFIIFSPVLLPAALTIGLAVTGILGSGAFGLTGLSSLSWLLSYLRQASAAMPNQFEMAKKKAQDMAGYAGQKAKDLGHTTQTKAQSQETGREGAATART